MGGTGELNVNSYTKYRNILHKFRSVQVPKCPDSGDGIPDLPLYTAYFRRFLCKYMCFITYFVLYKFLFYLLSNRVSEM